MVKNSVPLTNYEVLRVLMARERPMKDVTKEFLEYLKKVNNCRTIERNDPNEDYELKVQLANSSAKSIIP